MFSTMFIMWITFKTHIIEGLVKDIDGNHFNIRHHFDNPLQV